MVTVLMSGRQVPCCVAIEASGVKQTPSDMGREAVMFVESEVNIKVLLY